MKKILLFIGCITWGLAASGQILHPASWEHKFSKQEVQVGDEVDLIFDITIHPDWYLYSSDFDPELGPKVTEFSFKSHPSYRLVGEIKPIDPKEDYDEIFGGNYTYFRGKGQFRQTIKILMPDPVIAGSYDYQVCSDVDGKCIPFDEDFTFPEIQVLASTDKHESTTNKIDSVSLVFLPVEDTSSGEDPPVLSAKDDQPKDVPTIQKGSLWTDKDSTSPYSLLTFVIGAFLAGFLAMLTPCVYPMIPMTVTFFTNDNITRKKGVFNALFYGLSIMVIFTLLGTVVSLIWGADFANWMATHWLPNLFFFGMFVFFALWFLGMFEINLPSRLVNQVDKRSESGGLLGVFFMALTLVVVSFSCTGPFVGSILIASSSGHVLMPVLGMLGFSLAFAITFSAFAIFPEWLKSLPRSGSWLQTVKVFLGFIELALSLKFLSIVDQVYHWGILDRDVFIAIWIAILMALTAYLLGLIKLTSDDKRQPVSILRLLVATASLSFIIYLVPGMWGAPLKPLAGYLPPLTTMDFKPYTQNNSIAGATASQLCDDPKYGDLLHLPHQLQGYFELEQALDCALEKNKPIFIDFTGHGCVNCREMEAVVWSHPDVLKRLNDDFIVLALYVDEKKELPEDLWYTSEYDNKLKKTIGKQNADLQIKWYGNNAQPFYVLLDANDPQNPLVPPVAYNKSVSEFIDFLDAGKEAYYQKQAVSGQPLKPAPNLLQSN